MEMSFQILNSFLSSIYLLIYVLSVINLFMKYKLKHFDCLINTTIILYLLYFSLDFVADTYYLINKNNNQIPS